jgi:hypothetical protein
MIARDQRKRFTLPLASQSRIVYRSTCHVRSWNEIKECALLSRCLSRVRYEIRVKNEIGERTVQRHRISFNVQTFQVQCLLTSLRRKIHGVLLSRQQIKDHKNGNRPRLLSLHTL